MRCPFSFAIIVESEKDRLKHMSTEVNIVARLSVKACGCKPEGTDKPKRLCLIYGVASGFKSGEDNKGQLWSAITGSFEGVNIETGDVYRSGKLFLPNGIQEVVEAALKGTGDNGSIKFGLELRSVKASNPIGYSYQAVPLVKPSADDPLAEMRAGIAEKTGVKMLLEATALPIVEATGVPVETAKKGK